jgi:hypothetical protein
VQEGAVGHGVEQQGHLAMPCQEAARPEIHAVTQRVAGKAVGDAPAQHGGLTNRRDDREQNDRQQEDMRPFGWLCLTFQAHIRIIPCFPALKAHP